MEQMQTVGSSEVSRAAGELSRMKRSLRVWLSYRLLNDNVLAGNAPKGTKPDAKITIAESRDVRVEQRMATQLHALLSEVLKGTGARLPDPNLSSNPHAAVELAQIAVGDRGTRTGLGGLGPIPWPVVIVAGVLLTITTAIKTSADLAAEKERLACIKAGACTDYGFWLKLAAVVGLSWFAWNKMGVREYVHGVMMKKR